MVLAPYQSFTVEGMRAATYDTADAPVSTTDIAIYADPVDDTVRNWD